MTWWWVLVLGLPAQAPDTCSAHLMALDAQRALAFATADATRLGEVYTAGSPVLDADRQTLDAYAARGGRVLGAQLVISRCRVLSEQPGQRRIEVTDVLGPAVVRWDDATSQPLPQDRPTRRVVTLQHTAEGWRISGSQPAGPR